MTFSSIRLAVRLSIRDARRSIGRTILSIALLGLPIAAVTTTATVFEGIQPTPADTARRDMGTADAIIDWPYDGPIMQDPLSTINVEPDNSIDGAVSEPVLEAKTEDEYLQVLPTGTRLIETTQAETRIETADALILVPVIGLDLSDPMTSGMMNLLSGELPGDKDVVISHALSDRLGLDVGDETGLSDTSGTVTIRGVVELPEDLTAEFIVTHPSAIDGTHKHWLIDTPEPINWSQVQAYNKLGIAVYSQQVAQDPPTSPLPVTNQTDDSDTSVGLVGFIAAMVVLEIVLLAGPTFMIGAKRRSREFGLLAANGATPGQIRTTVIASGAVTGIIAAAAAIMIGLAFAAIFQPFFEQWLNTRFVGFRLKITTILATASLAIGTGVLSALVPAFVTAKRPVTEVLKSRQGDTGARKLWLITGVLLMLAGLIFGYLGVSRSHLTAVIGAVAIGELGMLLCTPTLLSVIAKTSSFLPPTPRMIVRDTGRNRGAAVSAVSAVMAVIAGGIAITMFASADESRSDTSTRNGPAIDTVVIEPVIHSIAPGSLPSREELDQLTEAKTVINELVTTSLPIEHTYTTPSVTCEPNLDSSCVVTVLRPDNRQCPYDTTQNELTTSQQALAAADPHCTATAISYVGPLSTQNYIVDSNIVERFTGLHGERLDTAKEILNNGGIIISDRDLVVDGMATLQIIDTDDAGTSVRASISVPAMANDTGVMGHQQILFSSAAATELQLAQSGLTIIGEPYRDIDITEKDAFRLLLARNGFKSWDDQNITDGDIILAPTFIGTGTATTMTTRLNLISIISGLLALAATAVATALAATEARRDLVTLAAVGASPAIRRKLSMFRAGFVSGIGAILGVVAGTGAVYAAMAALNSELAVKYPREIPYEFGPAWTNIAIALIAVPAMAMLGAGLLSRSRLTIERRGG